MQEENQHNPASSEAEQADQVEAHVGDNTSEKPGSIGGDSAEDSAEDSAAKNSSDVGAAGDAGDSGEDSTEPVNQQSFEEAESRAAELSEEERLQRVQVLKPIVEGALMAAGEALKLTKIQTLFDEFEMPSKGLLIETLEAIQQDCDGRGFALVEVASGWRFQVREDYAQWVNRLWDEKPQRYSRALLETLALVAYRQPITRGDIEEVRGVAVSSHIMKTLTEREWVKVVGHRDVPGRPALYATTKQFLDYFNMKSLDELPTLGELQDIESLNASLEFNDIKEAEMIVPQAANDHPEADVELPVTDDSDANSAQIDADNPHISDSEVEEGRID